MFRHALLEAQLDNVIRNNIISGTEETQAKMMLLTGPNASGKSIYLKQVRPISQELASRN